MRPPNDQTPKRRRFGDHSSSSNPPPSVSTSPLYPSFPSSSPIPPSSNNHPFSPPFPAPLPIHPNPLLPPIPSFPQIPNLSALPTYPPPFPGPPAPFHPEHSHAFMPPPASTPNPPRIPNKRPAPDRAPLPSPSGKPSSRPRSSPPNGYHHYNPNGHTRVAAPAVSSTPITTHASPNSRTLGSIGPVVDALALLSDNSPIIAALAQVLSPPPPGSAHRQQHIQNPRQTILAFRGFAQGSSPSFHALQVLSKLDLDILAWIFTVSKHGRKDDVARRIVSSLTAPLHYRNPPPTRRPAALRNVSRPHAPLAHKSTGRNFQGDLRDTVGQQRRTNTNAPRIDEAPRTDSTFLASNANRGSMPALTTGAGPAHSRGELLRELEQQLHRRKPGNTAGPPVGPLAALVTGGGNVGTVQARTSASHQRNKQLRDLIHEVLNGYDFGVPENPFNQPLQAPLGLNRNYVVFNSVQLSRGGSDPTLVFPTPPPINAHLRPEVQGGDVQIHLRCLRVEPEKQKGAWKQAWPFPASCRVNGHVVPLDQAQRYTNGKLAGLDTATNISPYLRKFKLSAIESNRVTVRRQTSTASSAPGQFVLFAQEVLVYSNETMTKSVHDGSDRYWVEYRRLREEKGTLLPSTSKFEMARQGVVQFLTDPDGLTVASMKVSLRCPLALTRITTPVKGKRCQHVQCFDLVNFLDYSRRSSKFDCPVCNKNTAYPAMLVISPYIEHALEKYSDCDEVEIFQDGSMVPVERKQTGVASDDEDDGNPGSKANGTTHGGSKPSEVVDLTLDSDDEDTPPMTSPSTPPAMLASDLCPVPETTGAIQGVRHEAAVGDGQGRMIEDNVTRSPGAEQQEDSEAGHVDQELDFTFRSDFNPVPWGDGQVGDDMGSSAGRLPQATNGSENWPVDVIAIDSD